MSPVAGSLLIGRLRAARGRPAAVVLALAVVVGGLIGYNSGLPPNGAPLGLAVAALGGWLIHRDRRAAVSTAAPR